VQLARNLASEWGVYGIRVNTISPGYIVIKMVEALFAEYPQHEDEWPKQNTLIRLSKPEEYRGAAVFLISDASSFSKCALFLESAMLSQNDITSPSPLYSN
jgi:NAD(P)-dependent dehydrogenase (short-subunit alcohol dehydrogenase family)